MLQLETKSTSAITALAFSPDGMRLLVGYAKGGVQEWDAFGTLNTQLDDNDECHFVKWFPNGQDWVCGLNLEYVRMHRGEVWDRYDLFHQCRESPLTCGNFLSDKLVVLGQGHPLKDVTGALNIHPVDKLPGQGFTKTALESSGVRGLDIHRDSRLVAWITGHAQLKLWRIDRPDKYSIQLKKTAKCVALSPDGKTVAVAVEWAILTFSTGTRFPLQELKGHKGKVTSLAFSPDGGRIVSGSWDETIREWDATTGKELRSMNWKIGQIAALSCAPDGTRIAAGSTSGRVMIWDVD